MESLFTVDKYKSCSSHLFGPRFFWILLQDYDWLFWVDCDLFFMNPETSPQRCRSEVDEERTPRTKVIKQSGICFVPFCPSPVLVAWEYFIEAYFLLYTFVCLSCLTLRRTVDALVHAAYTRHGMFQVERAEFVSFKLVLTMVFVEKQSFCA